jgi:hypothetical protein
MYPRWGTNNLLLNHPEAGAAASTLIDSLDEIPLSRTWHLVAELGILRSRKRRNVEDLPAVPGMHAEGSLGAGLLSAYVVFHKQERA